MRVDLRYKLGGRLFLVFGLLLALAGCGSSAAEEPAKESVKEKPPAQSVKVENEKTTKPAAANPASPAEEQKQKTAEMQEDKPTETAGTINHIPVTLVKTIDGDTIKILFEGKEQNVRYLLIDTPETNHPRLGKQPFGEEAKERNRELVNSGDLSIEFDVGQRYDKYNRLLAYVYVNGQSVQKTLLEEGLARVAYVYPPNTRHLDPYEQSQQIARDKGIGIWSVENYAQEDGFKKEAVTGNQAAAVTPPSTSAQAAGPPLSKNPPAQPSGSCEGKIKGSKSGIYHTPGSTYYEKTTNVAAWFCTPEEAVQAGYRAPKR